MPAMALSDKVLSKPNFLGHVEEAESRILLSTTSRSSSPWYPMATPWSTIVVPLVAVFTLAAAPYTPADLDWLPQQEESQLRHEDQIQSWEDHLARLQVQSEIFRPSHIAAVQRMWHRLRDSQPGLGAPQAGPTLDGAMELVWDHGEHHLELDIREDGFDWFYSNRSTGVFEDSEVDGESIPDHLRDLLPRLV